MRLLWQGSLWVGQARASNAIQYYHGYPVPSADIPCSFSCEHSTFLSPLSGPASLIALINET